MKEPALIGAAVAAIVVALIRGVIGEEQISFEVETAISTLVIFIVGLVVRQLVTPVAEPTLPVGTSVNHGAATVTPDDGH